MARNGESQSAPIADDELELLTPEDVANLFKVPLSWVYNATRDRAKNPMPHVKVGHYTRFHEEAVRQWLHQQKRGYRSRGRQ